ncbi:hypothetical protein ACIGMX_34500 [Streptomyces aquilus]|uniref:hypothetical protein n=1 Tax=Streptomyces aquilus TaxID=2548456 RepID=UPI0037CDBE1A
MPDVIISPTGVQGPRGNAVLSGPGAPGPTVGIDGDYYVDTANYPTSAILYGPRTAGAWPASGISVGGGAVGALLAANNLSDVPDKAAGRSALGLGSAAVQNASSFDAAGAASAAFSAAVADAAEKYVPLSGGAVVSGTVTFNDGIPVAPATDPAFANQLTRKAYVDAQVTKPGVFDVTRYGAVADVRVVADGAMAVGSTTLTSATLALTADDVDKYVSVKGAGPVGVTTLIAVITQVNSPTSATLSLANASGGGLSGAIVIVSTDNTQAVQDAVDAAEAYLDAGHTRAQVYLPELYGIAGPLNTSKGGNGQIVFGPRPVAGVKKILEFVGASDGAAAVRHWQQTVPQLAGSGLVSFGVYASTAAQITSINAAGNAAVICGPNEGAGYGVGANFSNMQVVLKNLTIVTTHSAYGLTYGAANLWGVANAYLENVGYGTAGTVASPSTDYTSPGVFGTGLAVGLALPAPGNNDHVVLRNLGCGGGYTYALLLTEHAVCDRLMLLYSWGALCPVGSYAGSVGSVHAMDVISASIEACINEVYVMGAGSAGVGPTLYANISTETSSFNIAGNSTAAMSTALGLVRLTGLFTASGVSVSSATGIEIVNGQVPRAFSRKTVGFTCNPLDRTLLCDTTSAGFTGTLPDATVCPTEYVFKNVGTNNLTVATTSSQLIYTNSGVGSTTATVAAGAAIRLVAGYNGTAWGWYAV